MAKLMLPTVSGSRVPPLPPERADAYVVAEYDKSVRTWGIPNNLIRTMGWHPALTLTEVDYANAFIFDTATYAAIPSPGAQPVPFPRAGFVDRITKELVINFVSLLNRCRYSVTHHSVIGLATLNAHLPDADPQVRAEQMLLRLVDANGQPDFEGRGYPGPDGDRPLYSELHLAALRLARTIHADPHSVTDAHFATVKSVLRSEAEEQIAKGILANVDGTDTPEYLDAYTNGALIELIWCIVHFDGLLNAWFTVLRVMDETDAVRDGIDFVSHYNATVPESIKVRNNNLLGPTGWGD